jgi:hypothetical protein
MLQNKLYSIESIDLEFEGHDQGTDRLDQDIHFDGHFPIIPSCGCLHGTDRHGIMDLRWKGINKASNIKYLGFISPVLSPVLRFEMILRNLDNGAVACNTSVLAKDQVVCSFKAEYVTFPKFSSHTPR